MVQIMPAQYITSLLTEKFEYGRHDCVLFASRWFEKRTGRNVLLDLPEWTNEREAMSVVTSVGGLEKAIDSRLERVEIHFAKDGDIGLYDGSVGIFSGEHLVCTGHDGLTFIDRTKATCAWSV